MKKILFTIFALGTVAVSAQISTNQQTFPTSTDENVFMDAASNFNQSANSSPSLGKGLGFPQTDLSTFRFITTNMDGIKFPSYFNGMLVYNTNNGGSTNDPAITTQTTGLSEGFYYFSNPNGEANGSLSAGKWVKVGGAALSTGVANGNFWSLIGNSGTTATTVTETQGTAGQPGTYTYAKGTTGNFMGTTDNQAVVMVSNNIPRLSIGATTAAVGSPTATNFNFVLDVFGKARFRDGIVTSNSTYPDYVFDKYFTGKSAENAKYSFLTLAETEKYIKENNHLPGVTSINDLAKENGKYMIDATQLSVQSLEKIEELYLHTIEQQKEIDALKAEIKEIKKALGNKH